MNKRAWAMTAPLVVLVALLVASCGDDSPTGTSPAPPSSADVVPGLTLVGSGLTSASEAPLAGVYVHGNYAFVGGMSIGYNTTANVGVRIVDLSNPANPVLVGRIPLRTRGLNQDHSHGDAVATHINSGAFQGDVAVVLYGVPDKFIPASYPQPHGIWDVTDPRNPTFLSVLNLGDANHGNEAGDLGDKPYDAMAVAGNYFYALYNRPDRTRTGIQRFRFGDHRLAVADISDPGNPVVVGDWQDNNEVALMGLSVNQSATRAYITGQWPPPYHVESTHGYLYILDIQNPSQPTEIGRYVFPLLVLCSQSLFRFADLGDDGLCRGGPDKGCGVIVSAIDVVVDRLD